MPGNQTKSCSRQRNSISRHTSNFTSYREVPTDILTALIRYLHETSISLYNKLVDASEGSLSDDDGEMRIKGDSLIGVRYIIGGGDL